MKRFIEGEDRKQVTLLPECLDDFIDDDNPVRIIEVFVEGLELGSLGFDGIMPSVTARPAYHPAVLLKIYYAAGEHLPGFESDNEHRRSGSGAVCSAGRQESMTLGSDVGRHRPVTSR